MSLRDRLQGIYDNNGYLTPALVVDTARDEADPLHEHFEWDDAVAGEAHRREQARQLIRSVRVTYAKPTGEESSVRAYQAVRTPDRGNVYESTEKVAQDPFLARLVLRDMERDWRQLKRRYDEFEEFWELIRADVAA